MSSLARFFPRTHRGTGQSSPLMTFAGVHGGLQLPPVSYALQAAPGWPRESKGLRVVWPKRTPSWSLGLFAHRASPCGSERPSSRTSRDHEGEGSRRVCGIEGAAGRDAHQPARSLTRRAAVARRIAPPQNQRLVGSARRSASGHGRVSVKTLPCPSVLCTSMRPPIDSTSMRVM